MNGLATAVCAAPARRRFDDIYTRHHALLGRLAWMLCGDPDLAKDLVQETWLRAWRSVGSLHEAGAAKAWLIAILKREYARGFERKRLELVGFDEDSPELACETHPDQAIYLQQLLGSLSVEARESLLMQVVDGVPVSAIADHFGVSRNAMTIRLHRLRRDLRREAPGGWGGPMRQSGRNRVGRQGRRSCAFGMRRYSKSLVEVTGGSHWWKSLVEVTGPAATSRSRPARH